MKIIIIVLGLLILSANSCHKTKAEWTVIYGELNDNLSYHEFNGYYYYDNIEYFFINNKTKKCYRNLDSNQVNLAADLISAKLSGLSTCKIDHKQYTEATISSQKEEYVNIAFVDKEGRNMLYKINLADTLKDNVFVYTKHKNEYLETIWTDRKSKTRRTKKLKKIDS